jgi:hypothetical protein
LFGYGFWYFLQAGAISPKAAIIAILLGASYPFWSAMAHRYRANQQANSRQ